MSDKLHSTQIIFNSIHAKQKALISVLTEEQLKSFNNHLAESKKRFIEANKKEITPDLQKFLDAYYN